MNTLGQANDTPLGNGQQRCKILCRSDTAVRSYTRGDNFHYKGIYRRAAGWGIFSGLQVYEWVSFSHQKYINGGILFTKKEYEWVKFEN